MFEGLNFGIHNYTLNRRNMIIHTHLLVKLTGPKYSEHSRPKTGQEEWSFCTNYFQDPLCYYL